MSSINSIMQAQGGSTSGAIVDTLSATNPVAKEEKPLTKSAILADGNSKDHYLRVKAEEIHPVEEKPRVMKYQVRKFERPHQEASNAFETMMRDLRAHTGLVGIVAERDEVKELVTSVSALKIRDEPTVKTTESETRSSESATSKVDAQCLLPAAHNVFVGNLPKTLSNDYLKSEIEDKFSEFGKCEAKIMRNNKDNNPHCFLQFWSQTGADQALEKGKTIQIGDRFCRVERSQANRTLIISKAGYADFTKEQMLEKFSKFGAIEEYYYLDLKESEAFVDQGRVCLIKFRIYDVAKKAIIQLRSEGIWKAKYPDNGEQAIKAVVAERIKNGNSIFVGNLVPEQTTEKALVDRFGQYGSIMACDVHKKHNERDVAYAAFAFIQYAESSGAKAAIVGENEKSMHGRKLMVQPRHCRPAFVNNNRPIRSFRSTHDSRVNHQHMNVLPQVPWAVQNALYNMYANTGLSFGQGGVNYASMNQQLSALHNATLINQANPMLWNQAMTTPPNNPILPANFMNANAQQHVAPSTGLVYPIGNGHLGTHQPYSFPAFSMASNATNAIRTAQATADPFTTAPGSQPPM